MSRKKTGNVGIIGDTHIPFERSDYLNFCVETFERYKCDTIVHIGDLVDNHAVSFHVRDCNGKSAKDEMDEADRHLVEWFKAFPKVKMCLGNHDERITRQLLDKGIPNRIAKSFPEIWGLPKGWDLQWEHLIDGVRYLHGSGRGGEYPHVVVMNKSFRSAVIGHCHTVGGVHWRATEDKICFAMAVGCGVERDTYAFDYSKNHTVKPVLSCGVVLNEGNDAQLVPMKLS